MLPPRPGLVSKDGGHDIHEWAVTAVINQSNNKHFIFLLNRRKYLEVSQILSVLKLLSQNSSDLIHLAAENVIKPLLFDLKMKKLACFVHCSRRNLTFKVRF